MLHSYQLHTERLRLRAPLRHDAPTIERLAGAYEVARTTLNIPHPYPRGGALEWIERLEKQRGTQYTFVIVRKKDDALLGTVGIGLHSRFMRAEIGYWIGVPYWGQGYATEAARRVVDFGFEEFGLVRIQATYFVENGASRRVMEKAGMQFEGVLRNYVQKWNQNKDLGMCAIVRDDWEQQ